MYVLTIRQPYATMIVRGFRFVDIRTVPAPLDRAGTRIAIHASSARLLADKLAKIVAEPAPFCLGIDRRRVNTMRRFMASAWADYTAGGNLDRFFPRGAIVGTAVIQRSYVTQPPQMWVWPFTEVRRLEVPVPIRGMAGLWWTSIAVPLRAGTVESGSAPAILLNNRDGDLTQMLRYHDTPETADR